MQQPQAQAAPIQPVNLPTYAPPAGAQGSPNPQQQFTQQLIGIARYLEQAMPTYQVLFSAGIGLAQPGQGVTGTEGLLQILQEASLYHQSALGSIRRYLAGEVNPDVLAALAYSVHQLARSQAALRQKLDAMYQSGAPERRVLLGQLLQYISGVDTQLNQCATVIQTAVGPQIWQSTYAMVFGPGTQTLGLTP